jgi:hypothetical protein
LRLQSKTYMGLIKKLFGGKELQFQDRVLKMLKLKSVDASAGEKPLSIRFHDIELDLKGLFGKCEQNQVQSSELMEQYFSWPLSLVVRREFEWNDVDLLLRPQLVPAEIAKLFGIQLFPFSGPIAAALVTNQHSVFVRKSDLQKWNISPKESFNRAVANLDTDPMEMEVTITDGTDRFIGLETRDGFDAVRILLPRVRDFASVKLGSSYLAGIPNRDFLILWSKDCSTRFQEYALEKIDTDYSIQNYPLTRAHFQVNQTSILPVA